ncbi:MAG TPA: hypothetical protein VK874_00465 [Gaiellaceae bacterium]|nr:hypothetical protein [Gaiellaceae bacterium]
MPGFDGVAQRIRELVQRDLVRVLLRRVRPAMPHQRLQRDDVAAALAQEPVGEAVAQLMRGEGANAGALAHTPEHPHQRLSARRLLRILPPPVAFRCGNPLLDLDREHVVIELRLELTEQRAELVEHVRRKRDRLPVLTFPFHAHPPTNQIDVRPATPKDLRPT